jgi:para-aminobenzoate synthetase component 1
MRTMPAQILTIPPEIPRLYHALRSLPWPCWLDSGDGEYLQHGGRYHLLSADPAVRVVSNGGVTTLEFRDGHIRSSREPVVQIIRELLGGRDTATAPAPFGGGAMGYFSYDFGRRLEGLEPVQGELPEVAVGIYDWVLVHDLQSGKLWLSGDPGDMPGGLVQRLESAGDAALPEAFSLPAEKISALISPGDYARAFRRIQHYLREGDCYQVNYAQHFSLAYDGDPLSLYLAMRKQNPAPYGALLELPFASILSSSPEQFLRVENRRVRTRPIKGTRPRGASREQDLALVHELTRSPKDRAENLMIVDLLRNDLGRVCEPGSIQVPELFKVESYPTVHHLVSTVTGLLAEGEDALSLLTACFPGGSITGAPKRRAMEIIQELEAGPRDIYCGSIGWMDARGNMDTSIAIRTLQLSEGRAVYHAGGGIVSDSRLDQEYQESLDKAAAFFKLFNREAETLRYER